MSKLIVGLTGGIGSGKSAAAKIFAKLGATVIDADQVAREVVAPGEKAYQAIVTKLGSGVLNSDNRLNRSLLRNMVFEDPELKIWLENLLHPPIRDIMQQRAKACTDRYCIMVIPLLFEADATTNINRVLVVDADEATQISRASQRDHLDEAVIKKIMQTQLKRKERLARADDVIDNSGDLAQLEQQVKTLHSRYQTRTTQKN